MRGRCCTEKTDVLALVMRFCVSHCLKVGATSIKIVKTNKQTSATVFATFVAFVSALVKFTELSLVHDETPVELLSTSRVCGIVRNIDQSRRLQDPAADVTSGFVASSFSMANVLP